MRCHERGRVGRGAAACGQPGLPEMSGASTSAAGQSEAPVRLSEQVISACSGSFLTTLFVTPLDVVRVRMQAATPQLVAECEHASCAGASSSSVSLSFYESFPSYIEDVFYRDRSKLNLYQLHHQV